jgi:hypothetical protein
MPDGGEMTTSEETHGPVRDMISEAAAWASGRPWALSADQVRRSRPRQGPRPLWLVGGDKWAPQAQRAPIWRARLMAGTVVAVAAGVTVALAFGAATGTTGVRLRLASYSLRLPSGFHLSLDQRTVCELTNPLVLPVLPNVGGGGGPPRTMAVGPGGECVVMAFLERAIGAGTAPARVVANPKPVMVNGHKGLIGTKAVRGSYDVQPAGNGGPFQKIAGLHKLNETLVVLTLSVPVANHVGDLAILEHGLSEKRLLNIVSSGLAADVAS